jgi:hypothetical protein
MPDGSVAVGVVLVIVLFGLLLGPFLVKEIRDGKRNLGPLRRWRRGRMETGPETPSGAGDVTPGTVNDPAAGDPSGQADPYSERAQRGAPPIRS